jgi:hypothetical protein
MTDQIPWDDNVYANFERMLSKIPVFMRPIAQKQVSAKAQTLAAQSKRACITEQDLVDAFFEVTPFGFHGPMKADMEEFGIDYQKYGHQ